jgi:hypothetical protein
MTLIGSVLTLWRRWRIRHDLYDTQPDRHPALARMQKGKLLAFNGIVWRIADVRDQPMPAVILTPVSYTHADLKRRGIA